jgi:hypothetical protein
MMAAEADEDRRAVFISHGNPQDNDFAIWLGTRLAIVGYEVWSDLTRLIGGEETWQNIDEAIRNHAAVVILVLSREGVKKRGLRNELAIADAVARKRGRAEFLLPVKIDDLPFDEVPPQVMPKNIIDFSTGWAAGLERVLKALERDSVRRNQSTRAAEFLDQWVKSRTTQGKTLAPISERLESNWFPILAMPERINFFEIRRPLKSLAEIQTLADEISWPAAVNLRFLVGFAELDEFQEALKDRAPLATAYSVTVADFLAGKFTDGPYIERREARNLITNLVRQAWEQAGKSKGLEECTDGRGGAIFWPRAGLLQDDIGRFLRANGKRGWRKLVGRDNTRNLYWHFGVGALPNLLSPQRLVLKPQVIFSRDGRTPLGMSQRRAVCKSWFNAKWRDLILAFGAFLADGESEFTLPTGKTRGIRIAAKPMAFDAPISLMLEEDRVAIETAEGDVDDFDGVERENDPAFFVPDELEAEPKDQDGADGGDL